MPDVLGILLSEVGNWDAFLLPEQKSLVEEVFREAMQEVVPSSMPPTFFWDGETMACFLTRRDIHVEELPTLTHWERDAWRRIARYQVTFIGHDDQPSLMVHNNHQPASGKREFPCSSPWLC